MGIFGWIVTIIISLLTGAVLRMDRYDYNQPPDGRCTGTE